MKLVFSLFMLLLLNAACHSPQKHSVIKKDTLTQRPQSSENKEFIDWDSVRLNGTILMISSFKSVVKKLGRPDSVTTPDYKNISNSFLEGEFKYCYYRGLLFEKYDDSLVFRQMDFRKANEFYLVSDKIILNSNTTIDGFKRVFPNTAENNELSGTDVDKNQWIRLPTSTQTDATVAWVFLFDRNTGKLINLEYWIDD